MEIKSNYAVKEERLAGQLKAMAHPARLAIMRELASNPQAGCTQLMEHLPLGQATVSQHLKALKEAGIIRGEVEGRRVCYCLDPKALETLHSLFHQFITESCCCGPDSGCECSCC